jgi:hypothetical protein
MGVVDMVEVIISPTISVEEGKHEAEIARVEDRTPEGYKFTYIDFFFKLENDVEIKLGFPKPEKPTEGCGLVKFMKKLRPNLKVGDKFELNDLIGTKVSFLTHNETTDKGEFARIVPDSIKLVPDSTKLKQKSGGGVLGAY